MGMWWMPIAKGLEDQAEFPVGFVEGCDRRQRGDLGVRVRLGTLPLRPMSLPFCVEQGDSVTIFPFGLLLGAKLVSEVVTKSVRTCCFNGQVLTAEVSDSGIELVAAIFVGVDA